MLKSARSVYTIETHNGRDIMADTSHGVLNTKINVCILNGATSEKIKQRGSRMNDRQICGECKHHKTDEIDWYCDNEESEYYTAYTEYMDYCRMFEQRGIE